MKISYKKLQTYFTDALPAPKVLADAFTFHAFEIESLYTDGDDTVMDIKVLPDRKCYAEDYIGIAREVRTILGLKINPTTFKSVNSDPSSHSSKKISVSVEQINEVLGSDISKDEIVSILERMDIMLDPVSSNDVAKSENTNLLNLVIPSYRLDIQDWRDIPEEVGRIYGYDKISSIMPKNDTFKPKVEKTFYYTEKIKNIFVDLGFSEVYTYSLVPSGVYEIEKPLASDKGYLRTNLSDGIAKSLELNAKNADLLGLDTAINIFEIGKVFTDKGESLHLSFGIKNIKKKQDKVTDKIKFITTEISKVLEVSVDFVSKIEGVAELDLDRLVSTLPDVNSYEDLNFGKSPDSHYKKISQYPFMVRDIAVFVPEDVSENNVWTSIAKGIDNAGANDLLARHSLFDTFAKKNSEGKIEKVSYAFRIVFQSMDKTLTDIEVNAVMDRINGEIKINGWEVR